MTEEVHQVNIYIPSQGSLTRVMQKSKKEIMIVIITNNDILRLVPCE